MSGSIRIVDMPDLGAFTSTSSIVGERAGSGRFSAGSLGSYFLPIAGGAVTGPVSFAGATDFYATDWMTPIINWPGTSSHMHVLSPNGCMAITGASDAAHAVGVAYPVAIGVSGFGFANRAGTEGSPVGATYQAWGGYFEARRYPGANTYVWGIEVEVANVSGVNSLFASPYTLPTPMTVGISLGSGAEVGSDTPPLTANTAGVAIYIGNNGSSFNRGIIFTKDGLTGTDGSGTGTGLAIHLATGHVISWQMPSDTPGPGIFSEQTTGTPAQLVFDNNVVYFREGTIPLLGASTLALTGIAQTSVQMNVWSNAGVNDANVSLGAADSGGAGYRVLRVPN